MKKFLSLLLAMIMSLSLVTISAGATEYEDLTDKDELGPQYQEAVAVLNKIGVITGYDDGSFRPDVKLTRGAAAKIIVSLLIGPEAATNLPNNYAPYPDVPTGHTFAGVISYCKTAGIISGYGDGTFKPANDLTGYAFAKMLLGALGYDASIEGFVDTGWTMNVLSVGQYASLFDRLDFHGSEAVTRKDAALMALNTLKSTVVEYNNPQTITVTGTDTNVVVNGGQVRSYKTSNQDYARNILPQRRDIANTTTSRADYNTVEFAEEHFVDLRLPHDKYDPTPDKYGRPSAEWSYRKLSIGKFPLVADFEYTSQVAHDIDTVTPASKVRALELNGYKVERSAAEAAAASGGDTTTHLWVNGYQIAAGLSEVAEIADYTDNGTLVQVYVDNNGSDFITDVVVVKSQLMTVRRVGSDYVSLELYKDGDGSDGKAGNNYAGKVSDPAIGEIYGFNQIPIDVRINNVETGDDYFEFLSGLKAGDFVVVEPVSVDGSNTDWEVGHVYAPETVKGTLNGVPDRFGSASVGSYSALSVDVGGTTYSVSLWNRDLYTIDPNAVRVTKKDVTLTLDRYGYAMLAQDVGSIDGWLIVGNYRQSIVNGILVTFANGWDLKGNEVSLNIGARAGVTNWTSATNSDDVWDQNALPRIGSLVHYTNNIQSNTGEWELSQANEIPDSKYGVFNVYTGTEAGVAAGTEKYSIRANSSAVTVENAKSGYATRDDFGANPLTTRTLLMANDIKFIYVTSDDAGELDTIEIKEGRTSVDNEELTSRITGDNPFAKGLGHNRAQAAVKWTNSNEKVNTAASVEAVVIKQDNSDATYKNVLYIADYHGSAMRDANGQMVQGYEVAMLDANGKVVRQTIYAYRTNLVPGNFARFTKSTHDDHVDDFYTLRPYTAPQTGKGAALLMTQVVDSFKNANKSLMVVGNTDKIDYNISITHASDRNVYTELTANGENNNSNFANMMVNLRGAQWVDLSNYKYDIDSVDDLQKAVFPDEGGKNKVTVTLMFNDDATSDNFRSVYMIIVNKVEEGAGSGTTTNNGAVRYADGFNAGYTMGGAITGNVSVASNGSYRFDFSFTAPAWAATNYTVNYRVLSRQNSKDSWGLEQTGNTNVSGSPVALPANRVISFASGWQSSPLPADGEIMVEITSITYGGVVVRYYKDSVSEANKIDYDALTGSSGTGDAPKTLTTNPSSKAVFTFGYLTGDDTAQSSLGGTISGLATGNMNLTVGSYASSTYYPINTGSTQVYAAGTGYVDVVITGTGSVKRTVTFGGDIVSNDANHNADSDVKTLIPTLNTWFDANSGIDLTKWVGFSLRYQGTDHAKQTVKPGVTMELLVNLHYGAPTGYDLLVEVVGIPECTEGAKVVKNGTLAAFQLSGVNRDITITEDNIKLTPIVSPKVVSGTAMSKDGRYYVAVRFDMPIVRIEEARETGTGNGLGELISGGYIVASGTRQLDSNTVLIEFTNDPTYGFYVPIYSFIANGAAGEISNGYQVAGAGWTCDLTAGTISLDGTTLPKIDVTI